MNPPSDNKALHDRGRRFVRCVERILPRVGDENAAIIQSAEAEGEGVKEFRVAYDFARDVAAIELIVPGASKTVRRGDHPHLTPSIVFKLRRESADRIKKAMAQASRGLHPSAPKPPLGLSPEQALWHFDLSRLRKAVSLLEQVGNTTGHRGHAEQTNLSVQLTAICSMIDAMRLILGGDRRGASVCAERPGINGVSGPVRKIKEARRLVGNVTGDLLRAAHTRSLDPIRDELFQVLQAMLTVTEAIREQNPFPVKTVKPPTARDASLGPTDLPGTYVAVLAVEQAGIAQFARLGTFWFPRGFLLYVGSAFQKHVGVAGRAMRHLKSTGPRLWGLDYLRGFAKPAELWWTHHPDKLECAWARALAGMPEYCCPAPLAGASDCNSGKPPPVGEPELQQCPAHLFHAIDMPSVKAFAKQLGRSGSGGYEIRRREWSESRGWPDVESTGSSVENDWLDVSW